MSHTVTNQRNGTCFVTNPNETILEGALRDNRVYPYGCRNGVCGACKCKLISGAVDYGEYEDFALTDDEKAQGNVLLCQAIALQDVIIDVEEIMTGVNIQIKMLPCRVAQLNHLAEDVIQLFLTLPKSQEFNFIAGQYIDIILKDGQRRSFSIGNLPAQSSEQGLELHIRHVPDGHFTPRVFDSMKERDLLRFEGPFGTYFFQSDMNTPVIMVAGGTGFSPIKGLIEQALTETPDHEIHLFWGARDRQDLYMNDLAKTWESSYPNFTYTPVLSESKSVQWKGRTGFVHQAVANTYNDFSKYDVYASGPPIMVNSVRDVLNEKGINIERFFFDSFEFTPHT